MAFRRAGRSGRSLLDRGVSFGWRPTDWATSFTALPKDDRTLRNDAGDRPKDSSSSSSSHLPDRAGAGGHNPSYGETSSACIAHAWVSRLEPGAPRPVAHLVYSICGLRELEESKRRSICPSSGYGDFQLAPPAKTRAMRDPRVNPSLRYNFIDVRPFSLWTTWGMVSSDTCPIIAPG